MHPFQFFSFDQVPHVLDSVKNPKVGQVSAHVSRVWQATNGTILGPGYGPKHGLGSGMFHRLLFPTTHEASERIGTFLSDPAKTPKVEQVPPTFQGFGGPPMAPFSSLVMAQNMACGLVQSTSFKPSFLCWVESSSQHKISENFKVGQISTMFQGFAGLSIAPLLSPIHVQNDVY